MTALVAPTERAAVPRLAGDDVRDALPIEQFVFGKLVGVDPLGGQFGLEEVDDRPLIEVAAAVDVPVLDGRHLAGDVVGLEVGDDCLLELGAALPLLPADDQHFRIDFEERLEVDRAAPATAGVGVEIGALERVAKLEIASLLLSDAALVQRVGIELAGRILRGIHEERPGALVGNPRLHVGDELVVELLERLVAIRPLEHRHTFSKAPYSE